MTARHWLERAGLPRRAPQRGLWLLGDSREAFEAAAALLGGLQARQGRLSLLLSSRDPALLRWLARRFPDCRALAPPLDNRLSVAQFLRRGDIRLAALLGGAAAGPALRQGLKRRAVPLVALDHGAGCRTASAAERLSLEAAARAATAERLDRLLALDLKARRAHGGGAPLLPALTRHPRWRRALDWRVRRLESAEALSAALGGPRGILCLGNGPSSEHPALGGLAYDCLFRVNHGWLERGLLTRPDVVFTGGRPSMRAVDRAIFGLQNETAAGRLMLARGLDPRFGRVCFFNVNDIGGALGAFDWGHLRPSNGAAMLATAVALRPARLIVAGIDLFQHPDGSYPGDRSTPNAYTPTHSRESELAFLLRLFATYAGELTILGDVLAAEWRRHRLEIGR